MPALGMVVVGERAIGYRGRGGRRVMAHLGEVSGLLVGRRHHVHGFGRHGRAGLWVVVIVVIVAAAVEVCRAFVFVRSAVLQMC